MYGPMEDVIEHDEVIRDELCKMKTKAREAEGLIVTGALTQALEVLDDAIEHGKEAVKLTKALREKHGERET